MQQLIDDLKSIPGVIGAYVFRSNDGVRCSNLPSIFKSDRIADMTKSLIKIHSAGKQNFPDLVEVFINYEESMLFCRQFNSSDYVIAICDPGMNLGVLAMSLNMALEEVAGRVEGLRKLRSREVEEEVPQEQPVAPGSQRRAQCPNLRGQSSGRGRSRRCRKCSPRFSGPWPSSFSDEKPLPSGLQGVPLQRPICLTLSTVCARKLTIRKKRSVIRSWCIAICQPHKTKRRDVPCQESSASPNGLNRLKGSAITLFARNDGQIIIHNLENPEKLISLVTFGGLNAQSIQKTLGFSQFGYLLFIRPQNQNLIIFSLDKYYLGILQKIDSNQTQLIDEISRFLFNLQNSKENQ